MVVMEKTRQKKTDTCSDKFKMLELNIEVAFKQLRGFKKEKEEKREENTVKSLTKESDEVNMLSCVGSKTFDELRWEDTIE